jgi:hypothetical protein
MILPEAEGGEETVNSGLSPVVAVVWFVLAIAAVTADGDVVTGFCS